MTKINEDVIHERVYNIVVDEPGITLDDIVEKYQQYTGTVITKTKVRSILFELALDRKVYRKNEETSQLVEQIVEVERFYGEPPVRDSLLDTLTTPAVV